MLLLTVPALLGLLAGAPDGRRALRHGFVFGMGLHTAGLYWLTDAILVRVHEFWWVVPLAAPGGALPLSVLHRAGLRGRPRGAAGLAPGAAAGRRLDAVRPRPHAAVLGLLLEPLGRGLVVPEPPRRRDDPARRLGRRCTGSPCSPCCWPPCRRWAGAAVAAGIAILALWAGAGAARLALLPRPAATGPLVVLVQGDVPEAEKQDRGQALTLSAHTWR